MKITVEVEDCASDGVLTPITITEPENGSDNVVTIKHATHEFDVDAGELMEALSKFV